MFLNLHNNLWQPHETTTFVQLGGHMKKMQGSRACVTCTLRCCLPSKHPTSAGIFLAITGMSVHGKRGGCLSKFCITSITFKVQVFRLQQEAVKEHSREKGYGG